MVGGGVGGGISWCARIFGTGLGSGEGTIYAEDGMMLS
jgi:hypothetical protein